MVVCGGDGGESNYTKNADLVCWCQHSFMSVTTVRGTREYPIGHGPGGLQVDNTPD